MSNGKTSSAQSSGSLNKEGKDDFLYIPSSVSTPPPGFSLSDSSLIHGERISRAATASAPPTSIFGNFDRFGSNFGLDDGRATRIMQRPSGLDGNSLISMDDDPIFTKSRTMSYNNLAAALGEGLAESMGNSLNESKHQHKTDLLPLPSGGRSTSNRGRGSNGVDNFTRQNRHSSRRGNSPLTAQQLREASSIQNGSLAHDFSPRRLTGPSSQVSAQVNYNSSVIVVEPSPCPTPTLAATVGSRNIGRDSIKSSNFDASDADAMLAESTKNLLRLNPILQAGRASAPPQLFLSSQSESLFHQNHNKKKTIPHMQSGEASTGGISSLQQALQTSRTPVPSFNQPSGNYSVPATSFQIVEDPALKELAPFTWESGSDNSRGKNLYPSRALAIFGLSNLQLSEVKVTCEAFGSLQYFRSEFFSTKGVLLIAYHDLRSARHAAGELKLYLQQNVDVPTTSHEIKVLYCVSLTSSSERDDSTLVISNVPPNISDQNVSDLLSSTYGPLRSVQSETSGCLIVEFYDTQDAGQALLEIQSTMPWGASATVSSKLRQDYERKRGQGLFSLIGSWRRESKQDNATGPTSFSRSTTPAGNDVPATITPHLQMVGASSPALSQDSRQSQTQSTVSSTASLSFQPATQLVVGPDGQYSYIMVQPQNYAPVGNSPYAPVMQPMQAIPHPHVVAGPHGTYLQTAYDGQPAYDGQGYWVQQPRHPMPAGPGPTYIPANLGHNVISHQPVMELRQQGHSIPMYASAMPHPHAVDSSISSGNTSNSKRSSIPSKQDENNDHLILDIEAVKRGSDTRTSLMVRNIPNKYTQSMLLSEFQDSNHGPGKIDFFYLPIDFRNKCNRGYAFVNFVDYRDIISFYDTYNRSSWKIFKSEKICCITYARIQGKEGMMKRFQNSALMEKNREYRPLVFTANGDIKED